MVVVSTKAQKVKVLNASQKKAKFWLPQPRVFSSRCTPIANIQCRQRRPSHVAGAAAGASEASLNLNPVNPKP